MQKFLKEIQKKELTNFSIAKRSTMWKLVDSMENHNKLYSNPPKWRLFSF